jgi:hypothetical protein
LTGFLVAGNQYQCCPNNNGGCVVQSLENMVNCSHTVFNMTEDRQVFSNDFGRNCDFQYTIERIKMKYKFFKIVAYKLVNGETAITTRQMAISVCKSTDSAQQFMKQFGVSPIKVKLPNHFVVEMIPLSIAVDFWKYLNQVGKGNTLTKLGQKYLEKSIENSSI